jgi:hypothetical protein
MPGWICLLRQGGDTEGHNMISKAFGKSEERPSSCKGVGGWQVKVHIWYLAQSTILQYKPPLPYNYPFERKLTHALHVNNLAQNMHVAARLFAATTFRKRAYKCTMIRTRSYLYKQPQKWGAE